MYSVVFECDDASAYSALGGNAVARLQFADHLLPAFLLSLLRQDEEKIEDCEDREHQDQTRPEARLTAPLQQECAYFVFTH